jgi:hypothetical protein
MAQAAGQPIVPKAPAKTAEAWAWAEVSAFLSLLPLWDRVIAEEPDLLE